MRRLDNIVFAIALLQCVLAPIPHLTALENLTFYPLLACVLALAYRQRSALPIREPVVLAVVVLSLYFLVTSIVGPYPLESLNAMRKDYLPPLTVFVAFLLTANSQRRISAILLAIAAGAAIRLLLVGIEIWILHGPLHGDGQGVINPYTQALVPSSFYRGFALIAAFYAPLLAASLLRNDMRSMPKLLLWLTFFGTALMAVDYGSRTPVVAMCAGLLVLIVANPNRRMAASLLAGIVSFAAYVYWQKPEASIRYQSIVSAQTYSNGTPGQGLTIGDRLRVWKGIVEIANEHPLLGHGYGWKKLALAVRDEGLLERWKDRPDMDGFSNSYFQHGYGAINPHNLAVQLYFEGGWLGIIIFLGLLVVVFWRAWRLFRRPEGEFRSLGVLAGCFFSSWLVANIGNSLWAGEKLPFVVMALMVVALSRIPDDKGSTHSTPNGTAHDTSAT